MQGAGHSSSVQNQAARESFEQHVKDLREISLDELTGEFGLHEVLSIDRYQQTFSDMGRLALAPLPETTISEHGSKAAMFADNTATYDEEGEDLLYEDSIMLKILDARSSRDTEELTALIRVRRSVVAFILSHWDAIEALHQPRRAG